MTTTTTTVMTWLALGLLSLGSACTEETDDPGSGGGGKADAVCFSSARSKVLAAPLPLPSDTHIGKPMRDAVSAELVGAQLSSEQPVVHPDASSGTTRYYRRGELTIEHVAIRWKNGTSDEFLRVKLGAEFHLIVADGNGDGKIDGWEDDTRGTYGFREWDYNDDGRVDSIAQDFATLPPGFVIEGYGDAWTPPAHPAMRVLKDTNYNGDLDEETITAFGDGGSWTRANSCDD